ncbi:MAG: sigma-70 family RNA polymerase sigma factor [Anaerolineae bacterium]|nr:sigma-70 family RNA polymerase sigma factor [Anaerolineae bacterium]
MADGSTTIEVLARQCAAQMQLYRKQRDYDAVPCYELFRRACQEQQETAWHAIYVQYMDLVHYWLGKMVYEDEGLINQVFSRFWHAVSAERFANFPNLGSCLAFLKRCAQTTAIDAVRSREREQVYATARVGIASILRDAYSSDMGEVLDHIAAEALYVSAQAHLEGIQEKLVFCACFEWAMPPRQIAARWPEHFTDAHEVSRVKERILRRLRRDEQVRALAGFDIEDEYT